MDKQPHTTILRPAMPAVTLDDALLSMSTFHNGCDFKLICKHENGGKAYYLTWGCYGVHTNLAQGDKRLLMNWLKQAGDERKLEGVSPATIAELLSRLPCKECGGFEFQTEVTATPPSQEVIQEHNAYYKDRL